MSNPKVSRESGKKGETVSVPFNDRIKTLDQLLAAANVDQNVWEVDNHVINSWENANGAGVVTPLFQVKAWLKRKQVNDQLLAWEKQFVAKLVETGKRRPARSERKYTTKGGVIVGDFMAEVGIVDHHFGKLAQGEETGHGSYDLQIAEEMWKESIEKMISRMRLFEVSQILFPFGNDALHFDGSHGRTAGGTPMDQAARFFKAYETAFDCHRWAIERFAEIAPVHALVVPGNHDFESSWHLGNHLSAWFRSDSAITFDVSPRTRKAFEFGVNLLGFSHGSEESLNTMPNLFAKEYREAWGRTWSHEIHIGHTHKMKVLGESFAGTRIRVLPTLTAHDKWHNVHGYADRRAAEMYMWSRTEGYEGHFSFNIPKS